MSSESHDLYEFTQIFGHALKLMKMANELPEFVISKSRDINAEQTMKILKEISNKKELLDEIASKSSESKISNDIDLETKKELYDFIELVQSGIERVKSPHFKLMIDRYNAAYNLANEVHSLLEELVVAEAENYSKKEED